MVIYHGILTLEKVGTVVNYHGIFITLAKIPQYFNPIKSIYHSKLQHYFYKIGPWSQCYKTFYHGNLPPFHGDTVILCYKAILP